MTEQMRSGIRGSDMPLLNYTTKVPAEKTATEIMALLLRKGATQVMMEFGPEGQPVGAQVEGGLRPRSFGLRRYPQSG